MTTHAMKRPTGRLDAPTTIAPRPRARLAAGIALTTGGSALAAMVASHALFGPTPSACGDACGAALASPASIVFGVHALAWAGALHVALFVTTWLRALLSDRSTVLRPSIHSAQIALMVILLLGSASYLVLGLASGTRCPICLTLHALAVASALGVALLPRFDGAPRPLHRWGTVALAVALWIALAWGASRVATRIQTARAAPAASTERWLAAVCEPTSCPSAARFGPEALPDEDGAIVLATGEPTLVAWLDLDCPACRADFAVEAPLFRALVERRGTGTGPGLHLVLRSRCDARGADPRACEAPAAVICAGRHGGPAAALDHLSWELAAAPGYYTHADRQGALSGISDVAVRCLDGELGLGARGTLAAHAESARRLGARARTHAGCTASDAPWWCFSATPSFAIIHAVPPRVGVAPVSAFSGATGELRREVLEQCLEVSP